MKVLFINPSTSRNTRAITAPLGLLSIASYLESKGHIVKIYDRTVDKTKLEDIVNDFNPGVVGISMISYKSIADTIYLSEELKKKKITVVVGGPFASTISNAVMEHSFFDAVSVGEGEETWLELVDCLENKASELSSVKGLVIRDSDNKLFFTGERDFIDLATLPPINWELIDTPKYFQSSYGCKKMLYLYSSKGCPHSCTFCFNKDFHKCTYRKRPLTVLLDEIKHLVTNYGMDGVYFADELWCRNKTEMREICTQLKNLNLDFVWGCQTRVGLFDKDDFVYMHECGCRWIFFGIESGSPNVLEKINKKIKYDRIVDTFSACKEAEIACIGSFIVGFPDETTDDLKKTVELISKLDTKLINLNYLVVVPGSDLYKSLIASGRCSELKHLEEFIKTSPMEKLEYNYSEIPDIDIKVVRAYYMWRSFLADDVPGTKKFDFAKKVITDAVKSVNKGELLSFVMSFYSAGIEFLKTAYYANCFPAIKKKYIEK